MKALVGLALAVAMATPSYAAVHHNMRINCGWPHPDPACHATPPSRPAQPSNTSTSSSSDPLQNILNGLLNQKPEAIANLNQALTTQAGVINTATGASWDPYSVMCLGGIPAVGTQGQPGYVPATPGLIAWIQGLQAPAVASVPPLPPNPSAATIAVHARLLVMAAQSDVGTVLNQINTTGIPSNLKLACGSLINDSVTQTQNMLTQGAAFAALLAKFVPLIAP